MRWTQPSILRRRLTPPSCVVSVVLSVALLGVGVGVPCPVGLGRALGAVLPGDAIRNYALTNTPFVEESLRSGAVGFLKATRRLVSQCRRLFAGAVERWRRWSIAAGLAVAFLVVVPLVDRNTWGQFRRRGVSIGLTRMALGAAVYLRAVADRRTPWVGKALLIQVVVYAVAPYDLIPDLNGLVGLLDDIVALYVASIAFVALLDERIILDSAHWVRLRQRRRGRVNPNLLGGER